MNKLTETEILEYVKEPNRKTGVAGISAKRLSGIDLDEVEEIIVPCPLLDGSFITNLNWKKLFKYDSFTPRAGSYAFKPSFAGSQILMGRVGRKLYFSNGRWFV